MSSLSRVTGREEHSWQRGEGGQRQRVVGDHGELEVAGGEAGGECEISDFHIPGFGFYPVSNEEL